MTASGGAVRRVLWVADNLTTGGIGTVSRYAAEALCRIPGWSVTLLSLRPVPQDRIDAVTGVRHISLGLGDNAALPFLDWLAKNPCDFVLTNDVPQIESAFGHFSPSVLHVIAIHDTPRRHVETALRNARTADGVFTVANHITSILRPEIARSGFKGVLATIHNGGIYPPAPAREPRSGPFRLLYMGSMDPFKGISDLGHILRRTQRANIPCTLTIAGGENQLVARQLRKAGLDQLVTWLGWVDHDRCYDLAALSDVLLMPSRKEAFGMVTIEAMAMGCVPIAYDVPSGTREIIESEVSGLLLPLGDFAGCAAAIGRLQKSPSDWMRLSSGAMKRARTSFTATRMAESLATFLTRVTENAALHPSVRTPGPLPAVQHRVVQPRAAYQYVPRQIRERLRHLVGNSPQLCHWLLNKW